MGQLDNDGRLSEEALLTYLSLQATVQTNFRGFVGVFKSELPLLFVAASRVQRYALFGLDRLGLGLNLLVKDALFAAPGLLLALDQFRGLEEHQSDGKETEFDVVLCFREQVVGVGPEAHRLLHALAVTHLHKKRNTRAIYWNSSAQRQHAKSTHALRQNTAPPSVWAGAGPATWIALYAVCAVLGCGTAFAPEYLGRRRW